MLASKKPSKFILLSIIVVVLIVSAFVLSSLLLCGMVKGASWCHWWPNFSLSRIINFIESSGFWGVGISIGIMIIHSFVPFPAEFVAIANGMIYGPFWGVVVTWTGAMLGAFLAFGLARKLGRPFVSRLLTKKNMLFVDEWTAKYGGGALFTSRFIPIIAFNLINYVAGLTHVSWWTFAWTTGIGILPMTILMVIMGEEIKTLPWQGWLLILAIGLLLWPVINSFRRK